MNIINQIMEINNFIDPMKIEPSLETIEYIINCDFWPEALPQQSIVDTTDKIIQRAKTINRLTLGPRTRNTKVLDFGCGNGSCTREIANTAKQVIGYDIIEDPYWKTNQIPKNCEFTTSIDEIENKGPFDYVLVHDVLDHILDEDILKNILQKLYYLIKTNGIICVRCHPWTSRHAFHSKSNKAFIHYFLPIDKLQKYEIDSCRKTIKPVKYYNNLFKDLNFTIKKFETINTPLESLFKGPIITNNIIKNWSDDKLSQTTNVHSIMEISFIDYEIYRS